MSTGNQTGEEDKVVKEREKQRKHRQHMTNLQFNDDGQLSREFIESIVDTSALQSGTVNLMQKYLDRNWILSNRTDAENHDIHYKLDVMKYKLFGSHPPEESAIVGPVRAFVYDDVSEKLFPLSAHEREIIESFFDTLKFAVLPRGRGGFEREALNTQVRESRTASEDMQGRGNNSNGRLRGLFNR